jgi:hypothetical protein
MSRRSYPSPDRPTRHRLAARLGLIAGVTATSLAVIAGTAIGATAVRAPGSASSATPHRTAAPNADAAAHWLAIQFNAKGYIPTAGASTPDYSDTAQALLALAATGSQKATARRALDYLEAHVRPAIAAVVSGKTVTDPGAAAFLILDAAALGARPRSFGGVDLVTRLLATMRTEGRDRGLFGAAEPTYDGAYREGLSLAALAGAGEVTRSQVAPAIAWTQRQQCADGAWQSYRTETSTRCARRDPKTYSGPDTNSTALAVEGLSAWKAAIPHDALAFLEAVQNRDGGWSYYGGGPSDTDSTAVVRQALVALRAAHASKLTKKGGTPASLLARDQIVSGPSAGAIAFQPNTNGSLTANLLATEQAVPAIELRALPF